MPRKKKTDRESIGKRLRFEVFKRDGFVCRYCGANPMTAVLQVDHVVPVSKGGTNDPVNLVTSCFSCNSGKSNIEMGESRLPVSFNAEAIREHAEQTREYLAAQKAMVKARASVADEVSSYWEEKTGFCMTPANLATARRFCQHIPLTEIIEAIDITIGKMPLNSGYQAFNAFRYFCGICWKRMPPKEKGSA